MRIQLLSLLIGYLLTSVGSAASSYTIDVLGLMGAEHTRNDGYLYSMPSSINDHGEVAGTSNRFSGSEELGESAWLFNGQETINIGLTGAEHTRNDSYKSSTIRDLDQAGRVTGESLRFVGGEDGGKSAWIYDGTTTQQLGYTGPGFTRNDGYRYTGINSTQDANRIIGVSERFSGSSSLGVSAWLYENGATTDLGLTGTEYMRSDGSSESFPWFLKSDGQVIGWSTRFTVDVANGRSAWLYKNEIFTRLGFVDAAHTRDDGFQYSTPWWIDDQGRVTGRSRRYLGAQQVGNSTWIYDGSGIVEIGLIDTEHTKSDGERNNEILSVNPTGYVAGIVRRYNGGSALMGLSSWLYDGSTTIKIGLIDAAHTRSDGYRISSVERLSLTGHVVGRSDRFSGMNDLGYSSWLYDGTTAKEIGLISTEHTRSDGFRASNFVTLNESGQVIGDAPRYNGGNTHLGWSTWLYDGDTTRKIGLSGASHTRANGYQLNQVSNLNAAGQAIGYARRYNGGSIEIGQDAWLFDTALNQTFAVQLSVRSDGYAYSNLNYLGEDGLALGYYQLFDEFDNDQGYRAFSFTTSDGVQDLGLLIDGGLSTEGWQYLASALSGNDEGQIIGQGKMTSQLGGQMAFLLTPISADFDGDGDVDGRDFLAWQRGFGKVNATLADGDANGDSVVDSEDLAIWQTQHGGNENLSASSAVPEPSGAVLALCAAILAYRVRVR